MMLKHQVLKQIIVEKQRKKKQQLTTAFKVILGVALRDNSVHTNIQTKIDNYTNQLLEEVSIRTPLK